MNLDLMLTQLARTVLIAALILFAFGPASAIPTSTTNQADLEKLQEQVRVLDKDNAVLAAKIDAQNNRITDLNLAATQQGNHIALASNQTSEVGNLISWTGVAISILVAVAGFITYFSATARAKAEANEAAKNWFDDKAASLTKQIADLEARVQGAVQAIDRHENNVAETAAIANAHIKNEADAVAAVAATMFKTSGESASNPVNQEAVKQVSQLSEKLEAKPEKDFTSADHFTRGLALLQDKNFLGALQQFEKAAKDTKLSSAQTAKYLFAQAYTLSQLDRTQEAIAVYDTLVQRYGEDSSPGVREQVAGAWVNKGVEVGKLHGPEQAIAVYDTLVQRYGEDSSTSVCERVAAALLNKGVEVGKLHGSEQAIAVYDTLVQRYGEDSSPGVHERVARALFNKGVQVGKLHGPEQAIAVYDTLLQRYGEDSSPGVRERVARAWVNKGVEVGKLHGSEQEIAVYDTLVQRYGEDSSPGVREQVAKAWCNKGWQVGKLHGPEQAIAVYDTLVRRYGEDSSPGVREQVARALFNKGVEVGKLHGPEQAIAVYDTLVQRYGEDSSPGVREQVAGAWVNKGVEVGKLHGPEQAIAVYDTLVQRYGEDSSPGVREQVAGAWVNKGVEVGKLHGPEQAIAVYDTLVQRYGEDSSPGVREQVAKAWCNKGWQVGKLNGPEQAIAVYDTLVQRYGEDSSPGVRELVAKARNGAAFNAMLIAKEHWADEVLRVQRLRQALTQLESAVAQANQNAMILGNLGYCFFLLGEADPARQWTAQCLQLGGAAQLEAQRGDARLHRLEPQDTAYEALLDELWGQVQASAAGA